MKKTLTTITLLAGAVAGYSQGTVNFNTYVPGTYVQRIYAPQLNGVGNTTVSYGGYTTTEMTGSTASGAAPKEKPVGTTVYTGGYLTGTEYDAQLLAAPGVATLANLSPIGAPISFLSGTAPLTSGLVNQPASPTSTATPTIPGTGANGSATVAIAAWDTVGGQYTTLAEAQAAGAAWGISPLVTLSETGGGITSPPNLAGSTGVTYTGAATSFSLGSVPEPSTIALGVMGASALLFRRRK